MCMVTAKQQAENEIRQAKILNELLENLTKNFKNVGKQAFHMAEVFKTTTEKTTQIKDKLAGDRAHERFLSKKLGIEKESLELKLKGLKEDREEQGRQKESRNRNRLDEIRTQGENVRHNLKMRQLYKDQGQSLSNVMNLMTGMSGKGAVMGGISTAFNTLSLGSNILETNKSLKEAQEQKKNLEGSKDMFVNEQDYKGELKRLGDRVDRLTAVLTEQREKLGMFGRFGGKGEDESKWAKRLEPIMSWAKKNKTGIIISAASIGLLFMTFKKLLSVSPMLQKMLEVMNLAFNLVLRPFGDFIGFMLRPIAMMMLSTVMPFFQAAYPFLMTLGSAMGEKFRKGDILGGLGLMFEAISPFDVLRWVFGDREGNTEGGIGTVGAVLGAGVLGLFSAVIISIHKMTGWVKTFLGIKTPTIPPPQITPAGAGTGAGTGTTGQTTLNQFTNKKNTSIFPKTEIIKSTIADVFKNLKIGKLNSLASIRGGTGGTAFMVAQLLDYVPAFKEARMEWFKWNRDMQGLNDPEHAWKGIDEYGRGIGTPDYTQQYPFAHNVDKNGVQININIDKVDSSVDIDMMTQKMKDALESSNTQG